MEKKIFEEYDFIIRGKFINLYGDYKIGKDTRIGSFCDIGGQIGERCKINSMVSIPPGVVIEDDVFVGPGCTFTNDRSPKTNNPNFIPTITTIKKGAKIGAGCTIAPGITIGENAFIRMGSNVVSSVPPREVWQGNPARKYCGYDDKDCTNCGKC